MMFCGGAAKVMMNNCKLQMSNTSMKKIKIIAVLLTVIVLCSACTGKNTTIKFEKFPVKHQGDALVEVFNLTTPVDKKEIDGLFALTERKAAILSVIPEKYDVILEIDEDNHKKVYGNDDIILVVIDDRTCEKYPWPWARADLCDIFNYFTESISIKITIFATL